MLPGQVVNTVKRTFLDNYTAVRSEHVAMWYPDVVLSQEIAKGQVIGHLRDYWGQPVAEVTAPGDGIVTAIRTSPATEWATCWSSMAILSGARPRTADGGPPTYP